MRLTFNGYLASITNPAGETLQFIYTADGLMTNMTDAKGNLYRYTYDAMGLLIRDQDRPVDLKYSHVQIFPMATK